MKKFLSLTLLSLTFFMAVGVSMASSAQEPQGPGLTPSTGTGATPSTGPGMTPSTGSGMSPSTGANKGIENPFKNNVGSLQALIKVLMDKIILPIGGVLCVLAFIYAGFLYVTAQGDEKQITQANTALLYAAIGTAILLGSWVLATAICKTIGLLGGPICTF